jgi:hypothetical protein
VNAVFAAERARTRKESGTRSCGKASVIIDFEKSIAVSRKKRRAGEEIRTLDIFLGKEVLYQLSYARVSVARIVGRAPDRRKGFFMVW